MKSGAVHDLVLVNVAGQPVRPAIYFYDRGRNLIDPESVVDVIGDLEATEYGVLTLQGGLHPLGEVTLSTRSRGEAVTGSVKMVSDGPDSLIGVGLRFDLPGIRVLIRFALKYTPRVAHIERGGTNLGFAVEDDILPSAEPTHEGDRVGETQSIVASPPQGDLASIGFKKASIANQTGARDVGVGDRHSSVRNKRSF